MTKWIFPTSFPLFRSLEHPQSKEDLNPLVPFHLDLLLGGLEAPRFDFSIIPHRSGGNSNREFPRESDVPVSTSVSAFEVHQPRASLSPWRLEDSGRIPGRCSRRSLRTIARQIARRTALVWAQSSTSRNVSRASMTTLSWDGASPRRCDADGHHRPRDSHPPPIPGASPILTIMYNRSRHLGS